MNERTITLEYTGVVKLNDGYSSDMQVNQVDIIQKLKETIDKIAPQCDYNGAFAGRVKIEVELLGDLRVMDE